MRDLIVLIPEYCLSFYFFIWLSSRTDLLYIKCLTLFSATVAPKFMYLSKYRISCHLPFPPSMCRLDSESTCYIVTSEKHKYTVGYTLNMESALSCEDGG